MDEKVLKAWRFLDGKPHMAIEPPDTALNDLCIVPNSGLILLANSAPKILSYYVPKG